jgi:hypothetical protein
MTQRKGEIALEKLYLREIYLEKEETALFRGGFFNRVTAQLAGCNSQ